MINAVIIDDEKELRDDIREKIEEYFGFNLNVIGEAGNVVDSVKLIEEVKPDLLFLDIELSDGTSFDILEKINSSNFQIIFITGFNEHAIKAIKVGALDYILKPVDDDEFVEAVKNVIIKLDKKQNIEQLIKVSKGYFRGDRDKRIVLKTIDVQHIVLEEDIVYCNSEGNYTTFYLKNNEEILISKSMKKVEELINKSFFIRSHQSYLVNVNYIDKYLNEGFLVLKNNVNVPVSTRRKDLVLKRIASL